MNDIFIDNNAACHFNGIMCDDYRTLYQWLLNEGFLTVSNPLLNEYNKSNYGSNLGCSILIIISELTKQNRLSKVSKSDLSKFKNTRHFRHYDFTSNGKDRDHVATIMLSKRQFAISLDNNLVSDIKRFPGFHGVIDSEPKNVPYDQQ